MTAAQGGHEALGHCLAYGPQTTPSRPPEPRLLPETVLARGESHAAL